MNNFKTVDIEKKESLSLRFLYRTIFGRFILKFLISKKISFIFGYIMDSKFSCFFISKFVNKNKIDLNLYENEKYNSFNEFFKRKKLKKYINYEKDKNFLKSPCDGKLTAYKLNEKNIFEIKNLKYSLESLTKEKNILDEFKNGNILIFRLEPKNYHRFHFIDDGKVISFKKINGFLHTVRPIAFENHKVFLENQREVTKVLTENFGKLIYIEVGALFVGKIKNNKIENFKKGDEKGYFEFGGSTVILITKENIKIFDEIFTNTKNNKETIITTSDIIGKVN